MKKHLMIAALATLVVPSAFAVNEGFLSSVGGVIKGTPAHLRAHKGKYGAGIALTAAALVLLARKNSVSVRALLGRACSSCSSKK